MWAKSVFSFCLTAHESQFNRMLRKTHFSPQNTNNIYPSIQTIIPMRAIRTASE